MNDAPQSPAAPRAALTAPLALIAIAAIARFLYLRFFSPYELIADEAHYWEWSRHPDWSYYSKGPGIAWCIRAATSLLGDAEWAIRTVPIVSLAITAFAITILARRVAPTVPRAPLFAAIAALLIPAFQATAVLCTIDAPLLACWSCAILAFGAMDARVRTGRNCVPHAIAFGALVGFGILVKYTMLLLPAGLLVFHLIDPPRAPRRARILGASAAIITAALIASPIAIWNAQRGWPTVHHLLGHLGVAGSDIPKDAHKPWSPNPIWPLEFIGTQIALVGPLLFLMLLALTPRARRTLCALSAHGTSSSQSALSASHKAGTDSASLSPPLPAPSPLEGEGGVSGANAGRGAPLTHSVRESSPETTTPSPSLLLICASLPTLILYLVVSCITKAEGNWAIPAYISLTPLAGALAAIAFSRISALPPAWHGLSESSSEGHVLSPPSPLEGEGGVSEANAGRGASLTHLVRESSPRSSIRNPSAIRFLWNASLVYGLIVAVGIPALPALDRIPSITKLIPLHRLTGARDEARHLAAQLDELRAAGDDPFVLADRYSRASLMAYYLHRELGPREPLVTSASALLGDRPSSYDFWPSTDPKSAALLGRDAILVGSGIDKWNRFVLFSAIEPAPSDSGFKLGHSYGGPRPHASDAQ